MRRQDFFIILCTICAIPLASAQDGWPWINRQLAKIEPKVNTAIPETKTEFYQRMDRLLLLNQPQQVLQATAHITHPDVQTQFLKARAYDLLNDNNKALELYQALLSHYPELADVWNNLGVVYARLKQFDLAQRAFTTALEIRPDFAEAKTNLQLLQSQQPAFSTPADTKVYQ